MDRTFVERLAELVQVHANAKQVYGDPIERNGAGGGAGRGLRDGSSRFRPIIDPTGGATLLAAAIGGVLLGFLLARGRR